MVVSNAHFLILPSVTTFSSYRKQPPSHPQACSFYVHVQLCASLTVLIYLFTFPAPLVDCVNLEGKSSVYMGFQ